MTDEPNKEQLDPITKLSVAVDNLKTELSRVQGELAVKDGQIEQMIQANKRLISEISSAPRLAPPSKEADQEEAAYSAFAKSLNIKEKK